MLSVVLSCALTFLLMGSWTEGQGQGQGQGQLLQQCDPGWVSWRQFCYLFVNSSRVTWEQAGSECQDRQAALLRIETAEEYGFLRKAWESRPTLIPVSDSYWTALNNLPMNEGASTKPDFIWGNDELPLDSVVKSHWDQEPDNTEAKDCVVVNVQGTLAMALCTDIKPFICQFHTAKDDICPVGWKFGYGRDYCYKVSNVSDYNQRMSWNEARKYCESIPNNKTTLLQVTSPDVKNFLVEMFSGVYSGQQGFWTALNDIDREGTFIWAGNGRNPFDATLNIWRKEPDNLGGNEHCGAVMPYGRWNDRNCDDLLNYACRLSLTTAPMEMNFGCGSWTRAGTKCVEVSNNMKTWDDARAFCQKGGGDLLSFTTQTDADWITIQALNSLVQRRHPGYWIGLNDRQTENSFVWSDGSQLQPILLNWDKEPNNNQYCSTMNDGGFFADFDCTHVKAATICEEPIEHCVPGWTAYGGHCYKVDMQWRTRVEASSFCNITSASYNGRLFALNSLAEKTWILSKLLLNKSTHHRFWSGLLNSGGWVWQYIDDQNATLTQQLVQWSEEPNNRDNEDCVEILANGRLNDAECSSSRGFICQKAAPGSSAVKNTTAPARAPVYTIFFILALVLLRMLV